MREKRHWKPNVKEKVSIWKNSKGTKIINGSIYIQTNHLPANERFDFRHQMITSDFDIIDNSATRKTWAESSHIWHTHTHDTGADIDTRRGDNQGNHQITQSTMKTSTFNCRSLGRERECWQTKKSFQNWSQSHGLRLITAKKMAKSMARPPVLIASQPGAAGFYFKCVCVIPSQKSSMSKANPELYIFF